MHRAKICLVLAFFSATSFANILATRLLTIQRWVTPDTIWQAGSGQQPETTTVHLRVSTTGSADTTNTQPPLDVVLALDLSGSMNASSGTPSRWRITWAQISARRFLDSLKSPDRAAVLGWTANGSGTELTDTGNASIYYKRWFLLSANIAGAKEFIADSIYLDSANNVPPSFDIYNGDTLVRAKQIPGGNFTSTPLNASTIVAMRYLVTHGDANRVRAVIMLTDGDNRDSVADSYTYSYIAAIYRTYGVRLFTIGFNGGNTAHLQEMADSGGGSFYNASNPAELDSVYAAIGRQLQISSTVASEIDTVGHTVPMFYDVLPDYINYVPNSFSGPGVTATSRSIGALTELQIFVRRVNVGDTLDLTYKITCDRAGLQKTNLIYSAANPVNYSRAVYRDFLRIQKTVPLGDAQIFVKSDCRTLQIVGLDGKPVGDTAVKIGDTLVLAAKLLCGTDSSVTVYARWVFQGDSTLTPLTTTQVRLTPSLSPQSFTVQAVYWNGSDSIRSGTITVSKSFPVLVRSVSTHEWVPDLSLYGSTTNPSSPSRVLQEIFGYTPAPPQASATAILTDSGYPGKLDGYLDYLDLRLSAAVKLNEASVREIDFSGPGLTRHWKGAGRDIYGIMALDATNTAYRIWLKPTFKAPPQGEEILETGMRPAIAFDNVEIEKFNGSSAWIGEMSGYQSIYETPSSLLLDSAAPVMAAFKLNDRACQSDSVSTVTVVFSEAVKFQMPLSVVGAGINSIFNFKYADGTQSSSLSDGSFAAVKPGESGVPVYSINNVPGALADALTLDIALAYRSRFKPLQTTVTLNPNPAAGDLAADLHGNAAPPAPSREASLSGAQDEPFVLCNLSSPSVVNIDNALSYRWGTEPDASGKPVSVPLFPFWGFTLVNPKLTGEGCAGAALCDTATPPNVDITIHIFDLFGNLVADPVSNPALHSVVNAAALWDVDGDGTYSKSAEVSFADLKSCQDGTATGRCAPYWNGVNRKGRVVAPGGYIVKVIINNGIMEPVDFTLKLVISAQK